MLDKTILYTYNAAFITYILMSYIQAIKYVSEETTGLKS